MWLSLREPRPVGNAEELGIQRFKRGASAVEAVVEDGSREQRESP
jgi:hypothetical protein